MSLDVPFATYCRVETLAGGVFASPRALIRAALSRLRAGAMAREHRTVRHEYLRSILAHNERARALVSHFRL